MDRHRRHRQDRCTHESPDRLCRHFRAKCQITRKRPHPLQVARRQNRSGRINRYIESPSKHPDRRRPLLRRFSPGRVRSPWRPNGFRSHPPGDRHRHRCHPCHRLPHHVPGQGWRHCPLQRTGHPLRPEHEQGHQPVTHRHRRDQINSLSGRGHRQTHRHRCPHDPSGWPRHKDRPRQHPVSLHAHPVRDGIAKGCRPRHHAFGTLFAVNSLRDRSHIV